MSLLVGAFTVTYNGCQSMPILDPNDLEFLSHSPEQSRRIGVRLGELLRPGDVLCLAGDLGSGKTTLAQGIARGWGAIDPVTSPTFVLVNEYRRPDSTRLFHLDAFRLAGSEEARELDLCPLFDGEGPLLIEWPERISGALPEERMWIHLRWVDESLRRIRFDVKGDRYERLLREFRKSAFGS